VTQVKSVCPWCLREGAELLTLRLPQEIQCQACGGIWTMQTPPHMAFPAQAITVNLLED